MVLVQKETVVLAQPFPNSPPRLFASLEGSYAHYYTTNMAVCIFKDAMICQSNGKRGYTHSSEEVLRWRTSPPSLFLLCGP